MLLKAVRCKMQWLEVKVIPWRSMTIQDYMTTHLASSVYPEIDMFYPESTPHKTPGIQFQPDFFIFPYHVFSTWPPILNNMFPKNKFFHCLAVMYYAQIINTSITWLNRSEQWLCGEPKSQKPFASSFQCKMSTAEYFEQWTNSHTIDLPGIAPWLDQRSISEKCIMWRRH